MSGELRVVLRLFSGFPDPEWSLPTDVADRILAKLQNLPFQPSLLRQEMFLGEPDDVLGRPRSGYRGFQIFAAPESQVPIFKVYNRLVFDQAAGRIRADGSDWEEVLWLTAPPEVREELHNVTLADVRAPDNEAPIRGVEGPFVSLRCERGPEFAKDDNKFNLRRLENNCYNYATTKLFNVPGMKAAIPGLINRRQPIGVTRLRTLLDEDKLEFKGMKQPSICPPPGAHWVAAMIRHRANGKLRDFHFLRLDVSGRWTHKDGRRTVDDDDDKGHPIGDLTQAHFLGQPKLAGFYWLHDKFLSMIK